MILRSLLTVATPYYKTILYNNAGPQSKLLCSEVLRCCVVYMYISVCVCVCVGVCVCVLGGGGGGRTVSGIAICRFLSLRFCVVVWGLVFRFRV